MTTSRFLLPLSLLLCGALAACGNKNDLLMPSRVPPEDAGRYLIRPKPATPPAPETPAPPQPANDDDTDTQ